MTRLFIGRVFDLDEELSHGKQIRTFMNVCEMQGRSASIVFKAELRSSH